MRTKKYQIIVMLAVFKPERVTSGWARFRGLAPAGRHRNVAALASSLATLSNLTGLGIEPKISRAGSDVLRELLVFVLNECNISIIKMLYLTFSRRKSVNCFWGQLVFLQLRIFVTRVFC